MLGSGSKLNAAFNSRLELPDNLDIRISEMLWVYKQITIKDDFVLEYIIHLYLEMIKTAKTV